MDNTTNQLSLFTKITLGLTALVLTLGAVYYFMYKNTTYKKTSTSTSTATSTVVTPKNGTCALTITSHEVDDRVSFPVTVNGTIDNTKASEGCRWILSEGQAGTAQIFVSKNGIWTAVGPVTIVPVQDWMTTKTNFSVTVDYNKQTDILQSGTRVKIRFTEEDPAGTNQPKIYDLPVTVK